MDFNPYIDGVRATGFPFENWAAERLKEKKWQIIANRYYVDDDENKNREIDIVAYKASSHEGFDLRTVIIISCKKSDSHHWAFLSRNANHQDPNSNWEPLHVWSNYKPISHMMGDSGWAKSYHRDLRSSGVKELFDKPSYDVFAFQELYCGEEKQGKKLGSPKGDSTIYASILSTIKSQLYEMSVGASPARKVPTVYQYNLLCLADAKFIQFHFEGGGITPSEIGSSVHIARYLVKRSQIFARVMFSTKEKFDEILDQYSSLHDANKKLMPALRDKFFSKIEVDKDRLGVFIDEFRDKLRREILFARCGIPFDQILAAGKSAKLEWDEEKKKLIIFISGLSVDVAKFNEFEARKAASIALRKIYKYEGDFEFDEDVPF